MEKTKISQAALRMLNILKALATKPLSTQEMLEYIEEFSNEIYRKEIVLKYINTIKLLNIDITKTNNKYHLNKSLSGIHFDKRDLSIIEFLKKYTNQISHNSIKNNIENSLQIIEQSFSKETLSFIKKNRVRAYLPQKPLTFKDHNTEKFENYCNEGLKLKILYKDDSTKLEKTYFIAPLQIIYKKGIAILTAFDTKENCYKEFLIKNILETEQTPQKLSHNPSTSVLFKLKNRLANSYVLKKGETIIEQNNDFLIVSNKTEDKNLLLKRLLRYFDQCEILYPKSYQKNLIDMITEMEKMYE